MVISKVLFNDYNEVGNNINDNEDKQIELANACYLKGRKSWTKGDKDDALAMFRKAVAIQESVLGKFHDHTARSYYFLGYALFKHSKENDKALVAYRRTLRIRLFLTGQNHISTEDVKRAIKELLITKMTYDEEAVEKYFARVIESVQAEKDGMRLADKGDFEKAIEAYEKCLAIENTEPGRFPLDIGHLYMKIADVYKRNKEYEMALNAYRTALEVLTATLGKEHADSRHCLKGIESTAYSKDIKDDEVQEYLANIFRSIEHCRKGDQFIESKEFGKAFQEYEAARSIEEASLGKYPLTGGTIRKKIASAFLSIKDYDRAIYEFRIVLSTNIFECGSNHLSVIVALKDIGAVMKEKGLDGSTVNKYLNTVSFSVKHERYAEHLLNHENDFSTAIEEFQKSLALEVSALGKYHLTQGSLFKGIGDAFRAKGNFDFAIVNYRNALRVYLPALGQDHIDTAMTLSLIGDAASKGVDLSDDEVEKYLKNLSKSIMLEKSADVLADKGAKEEAIEAFGKAILLEETSLVEYHLSTAELYAKIASVLKKAQEYDRAIVRCREILAIYLRSLGEEHPNTENALEELVDIVSLQGLKKERAKSYAQKVLVSIEHEARGDEDLEKSRYQQGMGEFKKALEIEEASFGQRHLVTATIYCKLADAFRLSGRSDVAIQEYRKTIRIYVRNKSPDYDANRITGSLGKCIQDLGYNEARGMQYQKVVWESVKSEEVGDKAAQAGQFSNAVDHYRRSISLEESVLGKLHPSTCSTYKKIASICRNKDDFESAVILYSKVFAIQESQLGKDDEETIESYNNLINASQKQATAAETEVDGWATLQYVLSGLIGLLILLASLTQILSNKRKFSKRLKLSACDHVFENGEKPNLSDGVAVNSPTPGSSNNIAANLVSDDQQSEKVIMSKPNKISSLSKNLFASSTDNGVTFPKVRKSESENFPSHMTKEAALEPGLESSSDESDETDTTTLSILERMKAFHRAAHQNQARRNVGKGIDK